MNIDRIDKFYLITKKNITRTTTIRINLGVYCMCVRATHQKREKKVWKNERNERKSRNPHNKFFSLWILL